MPRRDRSLEALLDLDGQTVLVDEEGHVARFSVRRMDSTESRPHGLSYSLTLHDRTGRRLLGFDNAHAVERPGGRFVEQPRVYDHVHRGPHDPGRPYVFVDAGRLVEDFWIAADRMLKLRKE
jgi:hypothetical protein